MGLDSWVGCLAGRRHRGWWLVLVAVLAVACSDEAAVPDGALVSGGLADSSSAGEAAPAGDPADSTGGEVPVGAGEESRSAGTVPTTDAAAAATSTPIATPPAEPVRADGVASLAVVAVLVDEVAAGAGFGDPYEVELPVVAASEAVVWLEGGGASVVALVAESAQLWATEDPDCAAVARRLDGLGSPAEIRQAALATPDPVTAEVLAAALSSVVMALGVCDLDDPAMAEHAWQWSVAHRRLVEFGVLD